MRAAGRQIWHYSRPSHEKGVIGDAGVPAINRGRRGPGRTRCSWSPITPHLIAPSRLTGQLLWDAENGPITSSNYGATLRSPSSVNDLVLSVPTSGGDEGRREASSTPIVPNRVRRRSGAFWNMPAKGELGLGDVVSARAIEARMRRRLAHRQLRSGPPGLIYWATGQFRALDIQR